MCKKKLLIHGKQKHIKVLASSAFGATWIVGGSFSSKPSPKCICAVMRKTHMQWTITTQSKKCPTLYVYILLVLQQCNSDVIHFIIINWIKESEQRIFSKKISLIHLLLSQECNTKLWYLYRFYSNLFARFMELQYCTVSISPKSTTLYSITLIITCSSTNIVYQPCMCTYLPKLIQLYIFNTNTNFFR